MCGIVAAVASRNVIPILNEGMRRQEYRGYDSAGIAWTDGRSLQRLRATGKVEDLIVKQHNNLSSNIGIAHTRWATHGQPNETNAHPHFSNERIAIVHNGIIENYLDLKHELIQLGIEFQTETDTEVVAHLINEAYEDSLLKAVTTVLPKLQGAFSLAVMAVDKTDEIVACRRGSPLVAGLGFGENYVASDTAALLPVTRRFVYLKEGELVQFGKDFLKVMSFDGKPQAFEVIETDQQDSSHDKGIYRHFMLKEIHEQPASVQRCLDARINGKQLLPNIFGANADKLLKKIEAIQIVACGTSYHSGLVAKYWIEELLELPCQVEVASEYRYRNGFVPKNCLFLTLSQSGETADTLAALRFAKSRNYLASLSICNVAQSSLSRESDFTFLMHAGAEIGVASTKAFTNQLVSLLLLTLNIAKVKLAIEKELLNTIVGEIIDLPSEIQKFLKLEVEILKLEDQFQHKQHALYLGRGIHYPIAMEGALKLKEISYIHAEAYPAGELKHGPLALIDDDIPVVVVAPNDELLEKLQSNMSEVKARGGFLVVFAYEGVDCHVSNHDHLIRLPSRAKWTAPILSTIPLQILSYQLAVQRGTDVDQPRNLAKSVTVE